MLSFFGGTFLTLKFCLGNGQALLETMGWEGVVPGLGGCRSCSRQAGKLHGHSSSGRLCPCNANTVQYTHNTLDTDTRN